MPHIHKLYDFVVSAFVICRGSVLLIHHKRYNQWLPLGGHIELNEDPEQALYREILEESGLHVTILAAKPRFRERGVKPLLRPDFVDVHVIDRQHKHIAFVHFARSRSMKVRLHEREHRAFRWFTRKELKDPAYQIMKSIRFYAEEALKTAQKKR